MDSAPKCLYNTLNPEPTSSIEEDHPTPAQQRFSQENGFAGKTELAA
jgi:hypothetical protein